MGFLHSVYESRKIYEIQNGPMQIECWQRRGGFVLHRYETFLANGMLLMRNRRRISYRMLARLAGNDPREHHYGPDHHDLKDRHRNGLLYDVSLKLELWPMVEILRDMHVVYEHSSQLRWCRRPHLPRVRAERNVHTLNSELLVHHTIQRRMRNRFVAGMSVLSALLNGKPFDERQSEMSRHLAA